MLENALYDLLTELSYADPCEKWEEMLDSLIYNTTDTLRMAQMLIDEVDRWVVTSHYGDAVDDIECAMYNLIDALDSVAA